MEVASLGLCKELYGLTEWDGTFNYWEYADGVPMGEPYLIQPELIRRYGLWGTQEVKVRCPAYDLDYLVQKLPRKIGAYTFCFYYNANEYWVATYGGSRGIKGIPCAQSSKSPAEAVTRLCIAMAKDGRL